MMVPFSVTSMETAMPMETMAAPMCPITSATARRQDEATRHHTGGQHVLHTGIHQHVQDATVATPAISAIGMLRSGCLISPATMFRSFHPSYAHRAATSAA